MKVRFLSKLNSATIVPLSKFPLKLLSFDSTIIQLNSFQLKATKDTHRLVRASSLPNEVDRVPFKNKSIA
jgi:hypothetical protein